MAFSTFEDNKTAWVVRIEFNVIASDELRVGVCGWQLLGDFERDLEGWQLYGDAYRDERGRMYNAGGQFAQTQGWPACVKTIHTQWPQQKSLGKH